MKFSELSSLEAKLDISNGQPVLAPESSILEAKPSVSDKYYVHPKPFIWTIYKCPKRSNVESKPRVSDESWAAQKQNQVFQIDNLCSLLRQGAYKLLGAQTTGSTKSEEKQKPQSLTPLSGHLDDGVDFFGQKDKAD